MKHRQIGGIRRMSATEKKQKIAEYVSFILLFTLAAICIVSVTLGTHQAILPVPMPQELIGEYSYDGTTWEILTEDTELSARNGDLFLRGTFLREMKEGWQLSFYRNHIGISIKINGQQVYKDAMLEIPEIKADLFASMCGREWMHILVPEISTQDVVEIYLHNPHMFGNKTAYRDFLTTLCGNQPGFDLLQKSLEPYGNPFRITGGLLVAGALMLLGAAIAAGFVRNPSCSTLFKLGLMTFFSGGFIIFDTVKPSLA